VSRNSRIDGEASSSSWAAPCTGVISLQSYTFLAFVVPRMCSAPLARGHAAAAVYARTGSFRVLSSP